MTLARGRILRDAGLVDWGQRGAAPAMPRGRRLEQQALQATERASRILEAAMNRASVLLADAERKAADCRLRAEELARAGALASVAALAVRLRAREVRFDEESLDRAVTLATLLAERMLGHTLIMSPTEIVSIARGLMAEAGGARRIIVRANVDDAPALKKAMQDFDPDGRVHAVVVDGKLGRGDLRLETDVGVVEGKLGPSLERLAARLREALRS